ncbi:hypothetical protein HID58_060934, partial [Brassica napus]
NDAHLRFGFGLTCIVSFLLGVIPVFIAWIYSEFLEYKRSSLHSKVYTVAKQYSARQRIPPPPETAEKPFRALIFDRFNMYLLVCGIFWEMNQEKMEAIDLNDDGQNDVMDEDIEDHEVLEDSEANGGTQPRQVQSRRKVSRLKTSKEAGSWSKVNHDIRRVMKN